MNNIYDLLREKPNEKEIIKAKIESVDPFGRALCSTPNGTFRAVGIVKKGCSKKKRLLQIPGNDKPNFTFCSIGGETSRNEI